MKRRDESQICFTYLNKTYRIDNILFEKYSNYFSGQGPIEGKIEVNLIDEYDSIQRFKVSTINAFLKYFQNKRINATNSNALQLYFLSTKYRVKPLTKKTEEYIKNNHQDIIFDFLTNGIKLYDEEENEQTVNIKKILKTKKKNFK